MLNGESVGAKILDWKQEKDDMAASEEDKGSIMSILATDLPLTSRQLRRILRRTGVGIARTGRLHRTWKRRGHDRVYHSEPDSVRSRGRTAADSGNSGTCDQPGFPCGCRGEQEAILNSMTAAERTRGQAGELYYSLSEYLEDQDSKQ